MFCSYGDNGGVFADLISLKLCIVGRPQEVLTRLGMSKYEVLLKNHVADEL